MGVILLIAIWQDMAHRKIPNALGLLASAFALLWSTTAAGVGLGSALLGGLVAFLVFVVFYVIGAMGAAVIDFSRRVVGRRCHHIKVCAITTEQSISASAATASKWLMTISEVPAKTLRA